MMTRQEIDKARAILIGLPRVIGFSVEAKPGFEENNTLFVEIEPEWTPDDERTPLIARVESMERARKLGMFLLGIE